MAILPVAAAKATSSSAVASLVCDVPTGTTDGHVMVMGVLQDALGTITVDGWSSIPTVQLDDATYFYRVASSEPASYTVNLSSTRRGGVIIATFSGVDTSTPIADSAKTTRAGGVLTYNSPTLLDLDPDGDYMLVQGIELNRGAETITVPSGYTVAESFDTGGSSSAHVSGSMAYKAVTEAEVATWTVSAPPPDQQKLVAIALLADGAVIPPPPDPEPGVVIIDPEDAEPIPIGDDVISWVITRGASAEITGGAQPGTCTLVVKNTQNTAGEDAYNPENGSSPLIDFLRDGTALWVGVNNDGKLTGTEPRGLFGGRFTDITPIPSPGATVAPTVEIVSEDALGWLGRVPVTLPYLTGVSHRLLRETILDAAGETRIDLANEILTVPLAGGDNNALALLDAINKANGTRHTAKPADSSADWYTYVTHNRQHRLDGTVDYTLSQEDDHVTASGGWRLSADTVTNQQKASVEPVRFTPSTFTVWQAESLPLSVTTARPVDVWMDFDDYVRAPVVDSSYSGSTPTITFTPFGTRGHLTITVASGTCTFTHLSIEGALARRLPTESHVADDPTSQVLPRGVRAGSEISGEYVGTLASARGIAQHVVWRYAAPQVRPTIRIENWFPYMFDLELGEIVSYTSPQLGVTSRHFEVVGLTHEGNMAAETGQHHVLTLVLQECRVQSDPGWFVLDTSELDDTDILAY